MTNPIIRKIEKMLRLAAATEGTPEGDTAARLAERWMREHAVSMAEIDLDKQADLDPLETIRYDIKSRMWRMKLFSALARHCSCRITYRARSYQRGQFIWAYGHRSDIEVARYLYDVCERQIQAEARRFSKKLRQAGWDTSDVRSRACDFRVSAVAGFDSRLREMRRDANRAATAESTALVANRRQRAEAYYDSFTHGKASKYERNFCAHGWDAGQRIKINAGVSSSGPTKKLE